MMVNDPRTDQRTEKMLQFFGKYVAQEKVVVADISATSRAAVGNALNALGVRTNQLSLIPSFDEAEHAIDSLNPKIVVCDYDLGRRCGLDLLQKLRTRNPDYKKCLFALVTGNTSQSAVARAAEEDVDTYLLKPYTAEVLRSSLLRAALAKINPSEYVKAIEQGKEELTAGKVDEAIATFTRAKGLDPAPSLALFYLGQADQMKKVFDGAKSKFESGLGYNKIHYKCMVGLFEVLMEQHRHADAYDVVKRISQYFPANPHRLTQVLRLAIMTGSYDDIERYYRIFTGIDERNPEMVRYICAALVVCGKYYLQKANGARALELFQKSAVTAAGNTRILREIVQALVDAGQAKPAEEYLKRFPPQTQSGADYGVSRFLITAQLLGPQRTLEVGQELLSKNIHEEVVYRIMVDRALAADLPKAAKNLVDQAAERWPDQKASLEALLGNAKKS